MDKPVVFFSHSGKDKEMLLPIKEKVAKATCNTLNIFMSSDGQSIPFGKNWIAQIEKGLQDAKLMFVFVTPASLESGWIYFETGYAYAKGIKVVPVGIGVSIGSLKPPINMLQGFDITSGESLNNILTIINREFTCEFQPCFDETDYLTLMGKSEQEAAFIHGVFSNISSHFYGENRSQAKEKFDKVKEILSQKGISFSGNETMLLSGGMRGEVIEKNLFQWGNDKIIIGHELELALSTYSFFDVFEVFKLVAAEICREKVWLDCCILPEFNAITRPEDLSSFLCKNEQLFSYSPLAPQFVMYKEKLHFGIARNINEKTKKTETRIRIGFTVTDVVASDISELVSALFETGIISK